MIQLFDMVDNIVMPSMHCHNINWLREIMDYFPNSYMKAYQYIFYTCCPDATINPYVNVPDVERNETILRALNYSPTEDWYMDDLKIEKALIEARKLYTTPTIELYRAAKILLDNMTASVQITSITWGGKDATGPSLIAAMKELPRLMQSFKESEMRMNEEINRSRGGQEMSQDIDDLEGD